MGGLIFLTLLCWDRNHHHQHEDLRFTECKWLYPPVGSAKPIVGWLAGA